MFLHNFIKVSAAVYELSTVT